MSKVITKDTAKKFRGQANAVLQKLAKEFGLQFDGIGTIRFSADDLRCKIEFKTKNATANAIYGNRATDRTGKSYKVKNTIYTVTKHNGKPKYCWDVVNQRGKHYCVAESFFFGAAIQHFYKNPFVK